MSNNERQIDRHYTGYTVKKLKKDWENKCLNTPEYQRGETWKKEKQEDLIYTILKGEHVPPLLFIENEELAKNTVNNNNRKIYDINDGLQRITSIIHFLHGNINIPTNIPESFSGLNINELKERFEDIYEDFISYDIGAIILSNIPDEETARVIFLRQQQGLPLTDGEKIHADFGFARNFISQDMHDRLAIKNNLSGRDDRDQKINFCARIFMNEIRGDLKNKKCFPSKYDQIKEEIDNYKRNDIDEKVKQKIINILDIMHKIMGTEQFPQAKFLIIYCVLSYMYSDINKSNFISKFSSFITKFFNDVKRSEDFGGIKNEKYQRYNEIKNSNGKDALEEKMDIIIKEWKNY